MPQVFKKIIYYFLLLSFFCFCIFCFLLGFCFYPFFSKESKKALKLSLANFKEDFKKLRLNLRYFLNV
ncbi:hypothetical protein CAV_0558 [Campylobacter avium LMG 24591]|uniref:Uncharacterized protein n=1 Tax=Campylobacter avium LMG 24591 TaxID=522484 RepID=A0A222MWE1_9BACT|nr:hypothetical protein CAV_0558 [Campylobacter avium LMG 24591]OYD79323.1 hypothetical protein CAV8706_0560 [Campylobacter avium]